MSKKKVVSLHSERKYIPFQAKYNKNWEHKLTEKLIVIENVDLVAFYGANNSHLQLMRALFPDLRISARDNVLRVQGDETDTEKFAERIELLRLYVEKYKKVNEREIIHLLTDKKSTGGENQVITYSTSGRPIGVRSKNQLKLVEGFENHDLVFVTGPAGTGKTYLSVALAVRALRERQAKKIILSRPAVEAGERLGFLPGDMREKIDPYLQPLYDALGEMLPAQKLQEMIGNGTIQIAPLAFMRGRTLNDAIVILDEAQNTTSAQLRMFLTRMGWNTKMIVTGDLTQVDLPRGQTSGLREAVETLRDITDIAFVNMEKVDIVRHKLVTKIVEAYDKKEL